MAKEDNRVLKEQIENLKTRLQELEEAIGAIRTGEVDALVVSTIDGDKIFSLKSAEQPYRIFIEEMNQGAIMLSENDTILYCNRAFANMVKEKTERVVGKKMQNFIASADIDVFNDMLTLNRLKKDKTENTLTLQAYDGSHLSTQMSASLLCQENLTTICLVVTDLTVHMHDEVNGMQRNLSYESKKEQEKNKLNSKN